MGATNVKFDAALDPNTEIVAGSVKVSRWPSTTDYVATKDTRSSRDQPARQRHGTAHHADARRLWRSRCADGQPPSRTAPPRSAARWTSTPTATFTYSPSPATPARTLPVHDLERRDPAEPGVTTSHRPINIDAQPEVLDTTPDPDATGVAKSADIVITSAKRSTRPPIHSRSSARREAHASLLAQRVAEHHVSRSTRSPTCPPASAV